MRVSAAEFDIVKKEKRSLTYFVMCYMKCFGWGRGFKLFKVLES